MISIPRTPFVFLALALAAPAAGAQTDFYNTDRGRPLSVEDAVVIERHAFELQAAPIRFERIARGVTRGGIAPELAWGVLPRTQLEVAVPIAYQEDGTRARPLVALAGVEVDVLHQLNTESVTLPAFALGAGVHLPVGPLAPGRAVATLRALATRTLAWGRVHVNASYAPGKDLSPGDPAAGEATRWSGGIAVDHTFALRSLLVGADVVALSPMIAVADVEWRAGIGLRHQLSPRVAFDAGLNRRLSAGAPGWSLTAGAAYAFAPPGMPVFHRGVR